MAKKIVNVVYKVDSKELDAVKKSLQLSADQAKKFDEGLKKVGKSAHDAGKDANKSFLDFKNILGAISFAAIISGLTSLGKKIFDLGVQQEQLNIAFTTFLGSAEKAKKLIAELTKFSIITPFTPDQVNKAAKTLLAFGTSAKDIIPTLKLLGDVSAGTGKDLSEMAVIFGQIKSTGRLMGQDLLQLINAGFNPLQIISEKTGKTVGKLKEEMEKGLVSFDMVKQAFVDATSAGGLFFNLMEKQSQTIGGKLSTVMGNLEEAGKNLFNQTTGPLKAFTDFLVESSEKVMQAAKGAAQVYDEQRQQIISRLEKSKYTQEEAIKLTELQIKRFYERRNATKELTEAETTWLSYQYRTLEVLRTYNAEADKKKETIVVEKGLIEKLKEQIKRLNEESETTTSTERLRANNIEIERLNKELKKLQSLGIGEVADPFVSLSSKSKSGLDLLLDEEKLGDQQDALKDHTNRMLGIFNDGIKTEQEIQRENNARELEEWEKKEKRKREIQQQTFDFGVELLGTLLIASMQSNRDELTAIDEKYSREIELAGSNEQAKKTLEKRREQERKEAMKRQSQDERDQRVKTILAEALVNSVKALGLPPIPGANFIAAAQALAFGAVQAVAVGKYKDGEIGIKGPGTSTSDSIPAWLSTGESVINAAATAQSPMLLEAINDRKINDNILRAVTSGGGRQVSMLDDSRIVKAIQDNRVDYINQGYTLMKVQKSGENFKRIIRAKIQGY